MHVLALFVRHIVDVAQIGIERSLKAEIPQHDSQDNNHPDNPPLVLQLHIAESFEKPDG